MGLGGICFSLAMVCCFMLFPNVEAQKNYDVGITLSKTCITMLENNFTTNCPTYEEINALFPDESNQDVSGAFYYNEHGFYERGTTKFINHFNFYSYSDNVTWIDPPGDIVGGIATITIEPRLDEYLIPGESRTMVNNTITVGHSRYIDDNCYRATISADEWIFLTGDTMNLLYHDCDPEYTNFVHLKEKVYEKSFQDITTSYKYQLDKWIESVKVNCKGLCFEY